MLATIHFRTFYPPIFHLKTQRFKTQCTETRIVSVVLLFTLRERRLRVKMAVFWGLYGATTQKTAIFVLTAVRTSNPTQIESV
jgi:hypothetical protein